MLYHWTNSVYFEQDFKFVILWVEEQALVWEPFLFPRSGRSIQIVWCLPFLYFLHPKCLILLLNHIMPPFPCISSLRMLTNAWSWTMRPCTIYASALWSLPPLLVSLQFISWDSNTFSGSILLLVLFSVIAYILNWNYEAFVPNEVLDEK